MSNSLDAYSESANPLLEAQGWFDEFEKLYPTLAKALLGNEHSRNGGPVRPPMTLMIRAKGAILQGMLSSPEASKTWFSTCLLPSDVLAAVESQLGGSKGEWIPKKPNGSGRKY